MTFEQAEQFGKYTKDCRTVQNLSLQDVADRITAKFPQLKATKVALCRIENGGVWDYEHKKGVKESVLNTTQQIRLRTAIAAVLGMKHQEARMANTTKKAEKATTETAVRVTATAASKKESGYRVIRKDRSFVTRVGFSTVMIKDTLANVKGLGLPTKDVKAALVKKFAEYVDSLDK